MPHLVILLHGVNGFASDLQYLSDRIEEECQNTLCFAPESIQGRTGLGIEELSYLLLDSVKEKINSVKPSSISFIGHGIGGLLARTLIGFLHQDGLFDTIKPRNYISVATPHLGSLLSLNSFFSRLMVLDQTGKDIILQPASAEKEPFLLRICRDSYLNGLSRFQSRTTFANASSPRQQQKSLAGWYQTGSIRRKSFPSDSIETNFGSLPSLLVDDRKESMDTTDESLTATQTEIVQILDSLEWNRMAIIPGKNDVDLTKAEFWASKQSQPLLLSILNIIKSDTEMTSLEGQLATTSIDSLITPSKKTDIHLVVLIHGLDGYNTDLKFIGEKLKERYPGHKLRLLAPECNHGRTYDGILKGATRILNNVKEELERADIKYISIVGHSLGGMYGRCLAGLLHQEGIIPNQVTPLNYISLATPHLGSREHAKILGARFTSLVLGSVIGLTGSELMLADHGGENGDPFLVELSRPKFTNVLKLFKRLIVYSNVRHDTSVHYSTAAIRLATTFRNPEGSSKLAYPAVVFDSHQEPKPELDGTFESTILNNLIDLPWKRYAVIPSRPILAHIDIIIKSVFWNFKHGYPTVAHLVDHFRHPVDSSSSPYSSITTLAENPEVLSDGESSPERRRSPSPERTSDPSKVHLVVLIHGMDGVARDLLPLAEALRDRFPRPMYKIIAPTVNNQNTGDGILNGAMRLYSWLKEQIIHSNADRISFVAQGLGGLYARLLLGLMKKEGLLPDLVIPVNFITIDTPHLGIRSTQTSDSIASRLIKSWITKTGLELNFLDQNENERGLLDELLSPEYVDPLSMFSNLMIYCSTNDPVISTESGLLSSNPVALGSDRVWRIVLLKDWEETDDNLSVLPWKRYAIVAPKTVPQGQYLYWNHEPVHPLIAHVTKALLSH